MPACAPALATACSYASTTSRRASVTMNSRPPSASRLASTHEICASSGLKGAALRTCQRINRSRSCARAGIFSKRTSDTLAEVSGTTSATRRMRAPSRSSTERSAPATTVGSWMLSALSAGVTVPSGSRSLACPAIVHAPRGPPRRTPVTRSAAISIAAAGGALTRNAGSRPDPALIRRTSPC